MTPWLLSIAAAMGLGLAGADLDAVPLQAPRDGGPQQGASVAPPASITAEIIILHGTNGGTGIDPRIGSMPALSKPPFSAYNSYKLLDRATLPLAKGKAAPQKLPTGRELQVIYKDFIQPSKAGELPRFVISASIVGQNGKAFMPNVDFNAKQAEWFFVGGQEYNGGGLVIGIKLN
jgi:hypothetical protein